MKDTEIRKLEMLMRVRDFGAAHTASFTAASVGGQKFAAIGAVVDELETLGTNQSSGKGAAQAGTRAKQAARTNVRERMVAIRETAQALEESMPGVSANFRLPRTSGDQGLISSARAFVESATPIKNEFTQREMPATFLEDLTASIAVFESAVNEKNVNTERRVAATAAINASLERGIKLVRELDPVINNKFRGDAANLAAWQSASHVTRSPKRSAPPTQTAQPSP